MAIHFLIPLAYRNIENLLFCEKEGIDQFPLFEKEGTGQFPSSGKRGNWSIPIIWKKRELVNSHHLEKEGIEDVTFSFFSLLQCYWRGDGEEVLDNSLLIPR